MSNGLVEKNGRIWDSWQTEQITVLKKNDASNTFRRENLYLYFKSLRSYRIFLVLRYEYIRKNAITAPTMIPAVVSQNANCIETQ